MSYLDGWIRRNSTRKAVSAATGISLGALSRYCQPLNAKHFRVPRKDEMKALYVFTKGAVRPDHFYDLPDIGTAQLDIEDAIEKARAA